MAECIGQSGRSEPSYLLIKEPEYLDTKAAATFLGVGVTTLEKWRTLRTGPPYTSLPRCIGYAINDLREFMAKHRIEAAAKPFSADERRGRPRRDGSPPNGSARHVVVIG